MINIKSKREENKKKIDELITKEVDEKGEVRIEITAELDASIDNEGRELNLLTPDK